MKKHNAELEHINRSGQSVERAVQIVETAVAAALEKLHMTTMEPLKVIYADSDGLTSLWRESPLWRAHMAAPTVLFTRFVSFLPCEHTMVIRIDWINEDRALVSTQAVLFPIFSHLMRTHFSCDQVKGTYEAFEEAWPMILEATEVLNHPIVTDPDPLGWFFADWVMARFWGPDPDDYEAALTYEKLMGLADHVFSALICKPDEATDEAA